MDFISIDLETTGLNPKTDKIIEIGAVKIVNGKEVEKFQTLINPGRVLDDRIIGLTGIEDDDLKSAPYIDDVFDSLLSFLGDYPLLGHSIIFDYSFLKKEAVNRKVTFEKNGIDTLKIARKYLDSLEHRNLGFLCEYYNIPIKAHRALEDARATYILYEKLRESFYSEEEHLFTPAPLIFKIKKDTKATKAQKERLYRLLETYNINLGIDIEHMTRSEASRETDKLLAKIARVAK